jgi:hypothetical protein
MKIYWQSHPLCFGNVLFLNYTINLEIIIFSTVCDIFNQIDPPNSQFLKSTDKSKWTAKDVADSVCSICYFGLSGKRDESVQFSKLQLLLTCWNKIKQFAFWKLVHCTVLKKQYKLDSLIQVLICLSALKPSFFCEYYYIINNWNFAHTHMQYTEMHTPLKQKLKSWPLLPKDWKGLSWGTEVRYYCSAIPPASVFIHQGLNVIVHFKLK